MLGARVLYYPAEHLLDVGRLWRIYRFLRREQFDVVHAHLTYANIIGTLTGRLAGIPTIASLRNQSVDQNPIRAGLETWLLRHWADRVMAVGHATAAAHQARLRGQQIDPIPSAVPIFSPLPPPERAALRADLIGQTDRPLLISVGRLHPQKGYDDLFEAFARLHAIHPEVMLVIAGGGELQPALSNQIKARGLENAIRLLGPRNDVPRLLAASDLFVSASHWEGLPVSVLEAMAAGLPVVATEVSDVPRVVTEGTGLLVPPHQPDKLAEAMFTLLENPAQRKAFGAAAQKHIAHNHAPAVWGDKIMALYNSLTPNRSDMFARINQ
jgi:glycosyltransferase involved in cell wall biosynthesis